MGGNMNNTQRQLIELFNCGIHKRKMDLSGEKIEWEELLDEAQSHNIKPIIYSAIDKKYHSEMQTELLDDFKRSVFFSGANQLNHINRAAEVLQKFNEHSIPVIALKGLVIRELYPSPEMRTMGDVDILVKSEDLGVTKKILVDFGYSEENSTEAHLVFKKAGYPIIEVHWTLADSRFFKGDNSRFEEELWKNTIEVYVKSTKTLSLSLEDLAVHLCLHMAVHMRSSSFGLRQLGDLVLLIEQKGESINWDSFIRKTRECGIEKFTVVIFNICNKLFHMEIPDKIKNKELQNKEYIDYLIQGILDGGVYGRENLVYSLSSNINNDVDNSMNGIKRFMKIIFPPINSMSEKYNYAKKHKMLTVIAWIHHLFSGILRKDCEFNEKIKVITKGVTIVSEKNQLIKWLEL